MVKPKSSRDEAQTAIFRGCARLDMAFKVKRIAEGAAQRWERDILREAHDTLNAALGGPLPELIIPPLPVALIEVQKRLQGRRPMVPSDIHSPFEQASSSPWVVWITHEDDPRIPSHIDLGDPCTFWWKDVEKAATEVCPSNEEDSEEVVPATPSRRASEKQKDSTSTSEPQITSSIRRGKRSRTDPTSDDEGEDLYKYVPKCDNCTDRGWVCRTVGSGFACTPCKIRKNRCSARGVSSVVKRNDDSAVTPVQKKSRPTEKSITEKLRSQMATNASGRETTPTLPEGKATGSVTPSPSKHRRVFVEVPPSASKVSANRTEQPNVGTPGRKWKRKQVKRAAAAPSRSPDPSASSSKSTETTFRESESVSGDTPTTTEVADAGVTPTGRAMVDKSVATENTPLDTLIRQTELLALMVLDVIDQIRK